PESSGSSLRANLRYLPQGVVALLVKPLPWSTNGNRSLELAGAEHLLWYPLLVLALLGSLSIWVERDVLLFPAVSATGIVIVYALSEGNLGTAFRHRGEVEWV